jgi:hypothetical protein
MFGQYQLRGYLVPPIGVEGIRERALGVRSVLNLPDTPVDMAVFLESLVGWGITLDVVEDYDMLGSEAYCVPETATIYLSNTTYAKACANDPRTRFTIFHELGHLILAHRRELHRGQNLQNGIKPYLDSEWQADQFSAEALMPLDVIIRYGLSSPDEIQKQFGVSEPAAQRRYDQLKKRGDIK